MLSNIIDELSEIVYISDLDTYEMLFLNSAGRRELNAEDYHGRKCYEILQGANEPCPFCTNRCLKRDSLYEWEFANPVSHRHYLLKDKLIEWEGRIARIEIAFDITEKEQQRQALEVALHKETQIVECLRALNTTVDSDAGLNRCLQGIGQMMCSDRAYVFELSGNTMSNTYEWCARGVTPEINILQRLPLRFIKSWLPVFQRGGCVSIRDLESHAIAREDPEAYLVLKQQDITSLVAVPLTLDGALIGYLGVDNPPMALIDDENNALTIMAHFVATAIQHKRDKRMLVELSLHDKLTGLLNRNAYIQDTKGGDCASQGVVFADVDGLKRVNDLYGHEKGDELLARFARMLKDCFAGFPAYRVGGDEFVVLCQDIGQERLKACVNLLKTRMSEDTGCRASIGYAWSAGDEDMEQLIAKADYRMYQEKSVAAQKWWIRDQQGIPPSIFPSLKSEE